MFRRVTRDRYLDDAEVTRLMVAVRTRKHANQPRDYALLALLANTGIRPREARELTRADVHPHARPPWIHIRRAKVRAAADPLTKLPIHPKVAKVLARYVQGMRPSDKLFTFTKRQSFRIFHYYARKAGLPITHRIFSLRHGVGMRLWRHTRDLRVMQAIMGHVHLDATAGYVHVSAERMREAHAKLGTVE